MQTLFDIDYTDQVLGYVQNGILKRESLDCVVDRDYVLLLIRESVREFYPSLKFLERIEFICKIYDENYEKGYGKRL